eukprot:171841_1
MSNNNNGNDLYQLELQKVDLMIGIWQEINRFSNRVLSLHINHRDTVYQMSKKHQLQSNTPTLGANTNGHSHTTHNGHSNSHKISKYSNANDTSSESDSDNDSYQDDITSTTSRNGSEYVPKTTKNHNKISSKKERKSTKGRCSGYNIYFGVRCKEIQRSDPNLEFAIISRNIGVEWKNLNKAQQQKWNEIAAKTTKQRQKEIERKEERKRDKKRTFEALNGNGMVSNVRIEDNINGGNMNRTNTHLNTGYSLTGPPAKKMRIENIRHQLPPTTNLLPMMRAGTLAMLNGTQRPQVHDMNKPALALLSEALKKMPALQPAVDSDQ